MAELTSTLFTQGDPAVVKKLEDCATGRPSEVASHFTKGNSGEHIRRVQQALRNVQELEPELGIPAFEVNGTYNDAFAAAVAAYKEKRNILNFAGRIDDVVGIKTIRSLDSDAKRKRREKPAPKPRRPNVFPRPIPNCVPDADAPSSQEFDITLLMGVSGGEIVEVAKFFFTIRDTTNGLSSLYEFRGGGVGLGASPITPAAHGQKRHFTTRQPVRVTRFGPIAAMIGATAPPTVVPPVPLSHTRLSLSFKPDGARGLPQTEFFPIDTGDISIPGGSIHGAQFRVLTTCSGQPGATRKLLGLEDIGPVEK
jgi:hypothetical protein